jgi:hypothetical protein
MAVEDVGNQLHDARSALYDSRPYISSTQYEVTRGGLWTGQLGELAAYSANLLGERFSGDISTEATETAAGLIRECSVGTGNPVLLRAATAAEVLHDNVGQLQRARPQIREKAAAYITALQAAHSAAQELSDVLAQAATLADTADRARLTAEDGVNRYLNIIGR